MNTTNTVIKIIKTCIIHQERKIEFNFEKFLNVILSILIMMENKKIDQI